MILWAITFAAHNNWNRIATNGQASTYLQPTSSQCHHQWSLSIDMRINSSPYQLYTPSKTLLLLTKRLSTQILFIGNAKNFTLTILVFFFLSPHRWYLPFSLFSDTRVYNIVKNRKNTIFSTNNVPHLVVCITFSLVPLNTAVLWEVLHVIKCSN